MLQALEAPEPTVAAHDRSIARAIDHLIAHYQEQPSLETLARVAGMSTFHFQRVFKRRAGISPKRFGQFLTVNHAKRLLVENRSVLDTALDVGLSGPSRLHDLFLSLEAMTPGEYKTAGRSLTIRWGLHDGPVGRALIGLTERGVCWFGFVPDDDDGEAIELFRDEWPGALLVHDQAATAPVAERAFAFDERAAETEVEPLRLLLRGSSFQIKVWEALLRIPTGALVSYQDIATAIGQPGAARAVGRACGANPLSLLIPCHRVIQKSGVIHHYRWGALRKQALIAFEQGRREATHPPRLELVAPPKTGA